MTTRSTRDNPPNPAHQPELGAMIRYDVFYTTSRMHARLHKSSQPGSAVYYVESKLFTFQPWFYLRKGDAKTSPMVAFVKFFLLSRHMLVGRGDCQRDPEGELVWEKLEREKDLLSRSDYHFSTAQGSPDGRLTRITWRKDRSESLKTVYHCVDEGGRRIASLWSGGILNWKKAGEVEVAESLDEGLTEILLATALGIWMMEYCNYKSLVRGYKKEEK